MSVLILTNGFFIPKVNAEEVSGDTIENAHWTLAGSPYVVASDIYVSSDATLTIDGGVIVKFDYGTSMIVDGKLEALGTKESPIYFTSFYDDSVGGNTNGNYESCYYNTDEDGNNIEPAICEPYDYEPEVGDWGVIFIRSATSKSTLNNVIDKYSGNGLFLMNGGSVDSTNFTSDKEIYFYDSPDNSFIGLDIPSIEISAGSSASITNATISNPDSNADAILMYSDSSLDIKNSNISGYNGVEVYKNSSLNVTDSSVECENDGVSVFTNSSLSFSGGEINCGYYGIYVYDDSTADITGVKINGASGAGLVAHSNTDTDAIKITRSEITENENGFVIFGSDIVANENSIHDNTTSAVMTYDSDQFTFSNYDFTNNFWGNPSGPIHSTLPSGLAGDILDFDNILYTPFLTSDPLIEKVGLSNVLFIPGLEASRLYKQKTILGFPVEDQLWEPNNNADVKDLYLNPDGISINPDIYTRDIIEETNTPISMGALGLNIYKSFVHTMNGLVGDEPEKMKEWKAYAYDWRQGVEDIVNNGTKYQNGNLLITDVFQSLVNSSKSGKVTIIAHSNGGLIAKALLKKLEEDKIAGRNNLIDSVDVFILVASPEIGTAVAVPAILHGYNQKMISGLIMSENNAREFGRNMAGSCGLLPSKEYIERVNISPVSFVDNTIPSNVTTKLVQNFGDSLDSYSEYKDFLFGKEGRINPEINQKNLPIILSEDLFMNAENLHNRIDNFIPPESLRVIEVAGWGLDTVASFKYWPKLLCYSQAGGSACGYVLDQEPIFTSDGDKTVVVPSAHYMSLNGTEKYWVDLKTSNEAKPFFSFKNSHKDIFEVDSLNNFIQSVIKKEDIIFDTVLKNTKPVDDSNRLRMVVKSPVTLDAYGKDGNHTGKICPSNSDFCYIEEAIANSSYMEFGEGKYLNLPEDQLSTIKLQGTDMGTFTYESEKVLPDGTSTISSFVDIPVTTQTEVEIFLNPTTQAPEMKLDVTGDGIIDFTIKAKEEFDPVFFLQVMKKTIESFDISKQQKSMLLKRINDTIKAIQKGKISKAELKIEQFKKSLIIHPKENEKDRKDREEKNRREHEREHKENRKPKQLSAVEMQTLVTMLNQLLDKLN